ncbi:50S ribosomal protein L10, partial [Rhodococcus hoagii]|nr:50S ribosomal protein L10 [Prescottella equi]
ITEQFKDSTAAVITEYRGLSVTESDALRRASEGCHLLRRQEHPGPAAAAEAGVEGLDDLFVGPTAIAFIKGEPVDAARPSRPREGNTGTRHQGGYMTALRCP